LALFHVDVEDQEAALHPQRSGVLVYLGIGSNEGDRATHLWRATQALQQHGIRLLRASSVYHSAYVGPGPAQAEYLNAVLEMSTHLDAWALLEATQAIERQAGRRPASHLQPRPLDLDLLFYGDQTIADPRLVLPHPRLAARRFVLEPLADLAVLQDLPVPGLQQRLDALRGEQSVTFCCEWGHLREDHGLRV
jgi:2-amino-4-hydroxy-6-hydroxymethyldihydropteridine diphosphokinase